MLDLDAFKEFRQGLALLRDGNPGAALGLLRHANELDPENSYYKSYYGVSLGLAEANWAEAERLCHTALCRGRRQAQLYLNLAEIYQASGHPQAAADTLSRGLQYLPHDLRLQVQFSRLTTRRPVVLGFLPRAHLLNRALGQWRNRVLRHIPRRKWLAAGASASHAA